MSETEDEGKTSSELEEAAEAARDEARGPKQKIFILKLEDDEQVELILPLKWKRMKFLKAMRTGDIWGSFTAIWPDVPTYEKDEDTDEYKRDDDGEMIPALDRDGEPILETHPELQKLEETDLGEEDFQLLMERLGETLMGKKKRPQGKTSGG